jgi:hypothetical protein
VGPHLLIATREGLWLRPGKPDRVCAPPGPAIKLNLTSSRLEEDFTALARARDILYVGQARGGVVTLTAAELETVVRAAHNRPTTRLELKTTPLLSGDRRRKPIESLSPVSALSPGAQRLLIGHPYHLIDADLVDRILSQLVIDPDRKLVWLAFSDATLKAVREIDQVIASAFDPGDGLDPIGGMWVQLDVTARHIWAGRTWSRLELPPLPETAQATKSPPTPFRLLLQLFVVTTIVIAGSYLWSRR